ncbi:BofC C-terminal domain-containing protein [Paenibacillus sp. HJGM_3]
MKQLKKRLRLNRRWLSLGAVVIAVGASLTGYAIFKWAAPVDGGPDEPAVAAVSPAAGQSDADVAALDKLSQSNGTWTVRTIRTYVCGEEIEQLGKMSAQDIRSLHTEHPQWQVSTEGETVTLREHIEDLSPRCKDTAYFGLDRAGNLSLFDGEPSGEKVIRTFFQLNMGFLESALPHETVNQLREGIRVTDLLEYNSVLSTFSDYAVEE